MTLNQIREDLKDIKYYYFRRKCFDEGFASTGENKVVQLAEEYNEIMRTAPPKFYDMYVSLYVRNHTQESLSDEMGYTQVYIQKLNKQLLKYILKQFSLKGEQNEENA